MVAGHRCVAVRSADRYDDVPPRLSCRLSPGRQLPVLSRFGSVARHWFLSPVTGRSSRSDRTVSVLGVQLNRLQLANPILVASGTFGYAREMEAFVDFRELGGIIPKTVTPEPRIGNPPPRTVETSSGLLNSIGLDNDGLEQFLARHLDYLTGLGTAVIANIAGRTADEFREMAARLDGYRQLAGIELNISCPNVAHGVDFASRPELAEQVVRGVRDACDLPILAKLTPNVTSVVEIAAAARDGGADAVTLINTVHGMAVDWRRRKPILGGVMGGLSGPAIKPVALRIVHQVRRAVDIPIVAVGGIASLDDVMEFLVTGASAVQIGTANFYNPGLANQLVHGLREIVQTEGVRSIKELIGTLSVPNHS